MLYTRTRRVKSLIETKPKNPKFWDDVEAMYLHKGWMIKDLVQEILAKIKTKKHKSTLKVKLFLCQVHGFTEIEEATEHIKMSFLERLQKKSLISELASKFEHDPCGMDYLEVTFLCNPDRLKKHLDILYLKLGIKSEKADLKSIMANFCFKNNYFFWGILKMPAGGSQGAMLAELLKECSLYSDGEEMKKGIPISRKDLEMISGYNGATFRDALKILRAKLRKSGFPVSIKNHHKNHFLMKIEY